MSSFNILPLLDKKKFFNDNENDDTKLQCLFYGIAEAAAFLNFHGIFFSSSYDFELVKTSPPVQIYSSLNFCHLLRNDILKQNPQKNLSFFYESLTEKCKKANTHFQVFLKNAPSFRKSLNI